MPLQIRPIDYNNFYQVLAGYYHAHGRHDLAWRIPEPDGNFDPYKILVSELMLQQTQVSRVTPKYLEFIALFPTVFELAGAELADVLKAWSGLGYNRRAKYLYEAARMVVREFGGMFPRDQSRLTKLPGVGPNTAGAIAAYAYDQPAVFLETNVRTVIIHHFFGDQTDIPDAEIRSTVESLLPGRNGSAGHLTNREFYWALMDYGTHLKKTVGNKNRASRAYTRQSAFHGSRRQVRGQVLRLLGEGSLPAETLRHQIADERLPDVLAALEAEGMVRHEDGRYTLG